MNDVSQMVELGITRLLKSERGILEGARVGLIANAASIDERGAATASLLLDARVNLTCLLSPEHGYSAGGDAGQRIPDGLDQDTGLPIRSLYADTREPTAEMMRDVDAIVFDLQDVGVRCYTYIWTMALAMKAAALFGKLFVVLDRPNPMGGVVVQGPILEPRFASFLGMYPIPLRHGMTAGELAMMFNRFFEIGADLAVIRMKGWRRRLFFADTGLKWTPPSPALRSPECALVYAGTCLFEGTNVSEGRGTGSPFRLIGAPWLDYAVLDRLDHRRLAGFAVSPHTFTPTASKFSGQECMGFALDVVDREEADPIALAVALLVEIASRHRNEFEWNEKHFDAVAGTDVLRCRISAEAAQQDRDVGKILDGWNESHRRFEQTRIQYLMYEG